MPIDYIRIHRFQFRWLHTGVLWKCDGRESNLKECVQKLDKMEMKNISANEKIEDYPWGFTRHCQSGRHVDLGIICKMPGRSKCRD